MVSKSEIPTEPKRFTRGSQNLTHDSIDVLNGLLEQIWHTLCCTFDASGTLPDLSTLFVGVDLSESAWAANKVFANMLLDLMENVGRFSPWYTRPARAFGLISIREPISNRCQWILAPEAEQKWQDYMDDLSDIIEKNYSLLKAIILVEGLMDEETSSKILMIARCCCTPPRTIQLTQSVLQKAEIICDACMQPFL